MKARDNPYTSERVLRLRYRLDEQQWQQLSDRLARLGYRAAIVGPHGSGKTTLLGDLEPHLQACGFACLPLRLDREHPSFRPVEWERMRQVNDRSIVLLDGAEQLSFWNWRRVVRYTSRASGLVITCHRPGRLPTLVECRTTPALLAELVRELGDAATAMRGDLLRELHQRHRGNLRDALRELYDRHACQSLTTVPRECEP